MTPDCLYEHAKELIPKAASYAARVLEMFFDKEIVPYIYSSGHDWWVKSVDVLDRRYPATQAEMSSFKVNEPKVVKTPEGSCCTPPHTPLEYGSLYAYAADGSETLMPYVPYNVEGCPSRFLYVGYQNLLSTVEPGYDRPVLPAVIWANLSVEPWSGFSLQDGFSVRLVEPKVPACDVVRLTTDTGLPLAPDSNSIKTFAIWGVNPDGTEDLLQNTPGLWPAYGGGATKPYKEYRIEFEGAVKGDDLHLGTTASEATENFETVTWLRDEGTFRSVYSLGGAELDLLRNITGDAPSDPVISVGGISYDQGGTSCNYSQYDGGYTVSWRMPVENDRMTKISRDSRLRLAYTGTNPLSQDFYITVTVQNPETLQNVRLVKQTRSPASVDNMTFGELFPGNFQNDATYLLMNDAHIEFSFRVCAEGGMSFNISSFSILP
jgi:hypothetical protein